MREPRQYRIELTPDVVNLPMLSENKYRSMPRIVQQDVTARIRRTARDAAAGQFSVPLERARLRIIWRAGQWFRGDFVAGNYMPTVKAVIDGLKDAGLFPDDNDNVITEMVLVRGEDMPEPGQLIIQVMEVQ